MKRINLFYLSTFFLGLLLLFLLQPLAKEDISFFGFAENLETEINYNYSVVVKKICVQPGQAVSKGDTLLRLQRIKSREVLQDQTYKIAELQAEKALWTEKMTSQITELEPYRLAYRKVAELTGVLRAAPATMGGIPRSSTPEAIGSNAQSARSGHACRTSAAWRQT